MAACPKCQTMNTSPVAGYKAHWTWFATSVHDSVGKQVTTERLSCIPESHDLCMRSRIGQFYDAAGSFGNDFAINYQDSPKWGLPLVAKSMFRKLNRPFEELLVYFFSRCRHGYPFGWSRFPSPWCCAAWATL